MADHALSPEGTYQDQAPVLDGVTQSTTQVPEGVNAETFPALMDLRRMLPAERFRRQTALAKVVDGLPEDLKTAATGGEALDMTNVTSADLDALAEMFTRIQDAVLDAAADREAMTEWLMDQEDPMQGVMYGFTRVQGFLGN